jgi:hypothetical protein
MKLNKETLKRIIKEELDAVMNEEDLDEGMRDLFLGGALAMGGIAGANKAYDTFNPNQDNIEQVDDDYGPQDHRNDLQKSSAELQHHRDAAESAAKQGDFDAAKGHLDNYHSHMNRAAAKAKFQMGDFDGAKADHGHGQDAVQKDLSQLKARYGG